MIDCLEESPKRSAFGKRTPWEVKVDTNDPYQLRQAASCWQAANCKLRVTDVYASQLITGSSRLEKRQTVRSPVSTTALHNPSKRDDRRRR